MLIDMHAHFYGEGLLQALEARAGRLPRVDRDPDGTRYLVTATSRMPITAHYTSVSTRLAWMAERGIATQLITFPGALGPDALPLDESFDLVVAANDELAALSAAHPGVFPALAGLPLADMGEAARELARASSIGLIGAILPVNYFLDLGQLETIAPVLDAADRLGAHLMIHPGPRADEAIEPGPWADLLMHRASTLGLQDSLSQAMVTLMHAGVGRRWPGLTLQVVNLGGTIPFVLERMDHVVATRDTGVPPPSTLLGGLYVDSASLGPRALRLAIEVFGADRVMMGSDYPIFPSDVAPAAVAALADAADRRQVGTTTARTLLDRFFSLPRAAGEGGVGVSPPR